MANTNADTKIENEQKDEIEEAIMHNMIEEFMNVGDEDNKIFNLFKDEFKDLRTLQYGNLMYIQNEMSIEKIPNISELLQIYEEIFSHVSMKTAFSLNVEKFYVVYNDGFVTIANNGMGKKVFIYKIKTIVLILLSDDPTKIGCYNSRVLRVLKAIKYI